MKDDCGALLKDGPWLKPSLLSFKLSRWPLQKEEKKNGQLLEREVRTSLAVNIHSLVSFQLLGPFFPPGINKRLCLAVRSQE